MINDIQTTLKNALIASSLYTTYGVSIRIFDAEIEADLLQEVDKIPALVLLKFLDMDNLSASAINGNEAIFRGQIDIYETVELNREAGRTYLIGTDIMEEVLTVINNMSMESLGGWKVTVEKMKNDQATNFGKNNRGLLHYMLTYSIKFTIL